MEWFCTRVYSDLKETACLPDQHSEKHRPSEATVHPDRDVIRGFIAGLKLREPTPTINREETPLPPSPHLRELESLLATHPSWQQRLSTLFIGDTDREDFTKRILEDWAAYLGGGLAGEYEAPVAVSVENEQAHDLFRGTTGLIQERAEQVGGSEEVLEAHAETLDRVYLLPCEQAGSETHSLLVRIEHRATPGAGRSARTVIWGRPEELQTDEFPPRHGNFDVYFLDETIQEPVQGILSNASDYWGLRQSRGFAELYRSLLGTFGTGRRMKVETGSLGALATLVNRIDESSTSSLKTGEGSFYPAEYTKRAPEPSKRERRDEINTRLRLRRAALSLYSDETPIADIVLPTAWQRERTLGLQASEDTTEDDSNIVAEWTEDADLPGPSVPPPQDECWTDVPVSGTSETKKHKLARTLSLLGMSALPGIRIVWMYGPEHPQIRGSAQPHWNPLEWDSTNPVQSSVNQLSVLRNTLSEYDSYLTWLTSVSNHPSQSASHAHRCSELPVPENDGSGSNLVSWVWFDTDQLERLTDDPEALIATLGRHGDQYTTSVLTTYWFCKNYKVCEPSSPLPTLANWQLRQLPIWNSILNVMSSVEKKWGADGDRLSWAVMEGGTTGAQGWRLFPTVDPEDTPLSEGVLASLGVSSLDNLTVSEAEYRLQKLLDVLAGELSEVDVTSLDIPVQRKQDWGRAYSQLLQPIMRHVRRADLTDIDELQETFSYLSHVPLQRVREDGVEWVAAPLSWLADHANEVRRYPEESPTPWEQKRVRDNEWYLLAFPQVQTGFADLATALGIERVEAQKPVPSVEDDDFDVVDPRRERLDLGADRQALRRRQTLLLASTGITDDDRIVEEAEKLETAIENLAVAKTFPPRVAEQLSDPRSGLYETEEGELGLVYNSGEVDDLERDALAMGLALLFEQYRSVSVFETALDPNQTRGALRERWRKETFPVRTVESAIEDHTRRSVRKKLSAGRALLQRIGSGNQNIPRAEALIEEFDRADVTAEAEETRIIELLGRAVRSDETLDEAVPAELAEYLHACRESEGWVRVMLAKLFKADATTRTWRDLLSERVPNNQARPVIEWLIEHEPLFAEPHLPDEFVPTTKRFMAVYRTWARTSDPAEQFGSAQEWRAEVRDQYRTIETEPADSLPSGLLEITNLSSDTRWFTLENVDRLNKQVIKPFWEHLESEAIINDTTYQALVEFVNSGQFGLQNDESRSDNKSQAFADAEDAIIGDSIDDFDSVSQDLRESSVDDPTQGEDSVRGSPNGSGGGGSTQLRGRGEQAEVAVTLDILQSVKMWLENDDDRYDQFINKIGKLEDEQRNDVVAYQWHTKTEWKDNLRPLLDEMSGTVRTHFTDYERVLKEGKRLDDLAPVKLIDVSGENGPGFDVIDPFGPLRGRGKDIPNWELNPTPIEIKAVSGESSPYDFRFTTNEFRQAKRFTQSGIPYVLRFVFVPDPEVDDWLPSTRCVGERIFKEPEELDRMISDLPFEDVIKGGYLNVTVGEGGEG